MAIPKAIAALLPLFAVGSTAILPWIRKKLTRKVEIGVGKHATCYELYADASGNHSKYVMIMRTADRDLAEKMMYALLYDNVCKHLSLIPIMANVPILDWFNVNSAAVSKLIARSSKAERYRLEMMKRVEKSYGTRV